MHSLRGRLRGVEQVARILALTGGCRYKLDSLVLVFRVLNGGSRKMIQVVLLLAASEVNFTALLHRTRVYLGWKSFYAPRATLCNP